MNRILVGLLAIALLQRCISVPDAAERRVLGVGPVVKAQTRNLAPALARQIAAAKVGDEIRIKLLRGEVVTAITEGVDQEEGVTIWWGRIPSAKVYGGAVIVTLGARAIGLIQIDNVLRTLDTIERSGEPGDDTTLVTEIAQELFPQEESPALRELGEMIELEEAIDAIRASVESPVTLSVLLVVPPALKDWCTPPGLWLLEAMSKASIDSVWAKFTGGAVVSRISTYCTSHVPGTDSLTELDWVTADPDVKAQRTATKSNLVALFTTETKGCGISNGNTSVTNENAAARAFSVVRFDCAWDNYSLVHELGHSLAMNHDRFEQEGGDSTKCSYGFTILEDGKPAGRSVMAYSDYCKSINVDCPRYGVLSYGLTADGIQFGIPCGTTDAASNVDQLLVAAPVAAKWE
ncbi:MAG TPA: M12 family metallo-peptidase [Thermoanaerobaculia bacterium]|nr:M12 family metallo-peptidase [Thermoanaerobaculia bacterium]